MRLRDHDHICSAVLECLGDGPLPSWEIVDQLAGRFHVTEAERAQRYKSNVPVWTNDVAWALARLVQSRKILRQGKRRAPDGGKRGIYSLAMRESSRDAEVPGDRLTPIQKARVTRRKKTRQQQSQPNPPAAPAPEDGNLTPIQKAWITRRKRAGRQNPAPNLKAKRCDFCQDDLPGLMTRHHHYPKQDRDGNPEREATSTLCWSCHNGLVHHGIITREELIAATAATRAGTRKVTHDQDYCQIRADIDAGRRKSAASYRKF